MEPYEKRFCARTLVTLWALFWVYFAFAVTWSEGKGCWSVAIPTAIVLAIAGGNAAAAWFQERWGSVLLLVTGLLLTVWTLVLPHFSSMNLLFVLGTLDVPPLLAGALLWSLHHK